MSLPEELKGVRDRTSMYVRHVEYFSVAACITGFDLARKSEFLKGFSDWLGSRIAENARHMAWPVKVLYLAFPDCELPWDKLDSKETHEHAISTLFDCLDQFLQDADYSDD